MKANSLLWKQVHLVFPSIPFLVETFIRIGVNQCLSWYSFNAPTLALTVSFICLFMIVSLSNSAYGIENDEQKAERLNTVEIFKCFLIGIYSLFVALIIFEELTLKYEDLKKTLIIFKIATYTICPLAIVWAVKAQQSFKLISNKL